MNREDDVKEYVPGKLYFPRSTMNCFPTKVEVLGHEVVGYDALFRLGYVMFLSFSSVFVDHGYGYINAAKCLAGEEVVFLISHKWNPYREQWVYTSCELIPIEEINDHKE